ncbi:MAG TPA: glycosyltransferase [Solirubrobacteraceae bacterium]
MTEPPRGQADQPGSAGPKTTVVIPVWDDYVSERLEQALQSVRAQSTPPPPVVVVDNASAVPLPTLPGAWVVRAPARLTLGAARNLGLTRVETPYVVFWDADDVMLECTLPFLEAAISDDTGLVAFATAVVEEHSGKRHRWPRRWVKRLLRSPRRFAFLDAIWSLYPSTGSTIMLADAVRAAGGYADADSGEDWCLGVSLAFRGRLEWSERPGRLYRVHPGSTQAQHMAPADMLRHARAVRHRICTDPGIPEWARWSLPLLWLGQRAAIAAHVALERLRKEHQLSGSA